MDAAGVAKAVLSLAGPGVQAEPDAAKATALARRCNDALAGQVARRPDRYAGFAHLAPQDPEGASAELRRCVAELGFAGALINGQTQGVYLDDPRYEAFWATAAELKAPIYLHPGNPEAKPAVFKGWNVLWGPLWSWTAETAAHALRLVVAGVFRAPPRGAADLGPYGRVPALPPVAPRQPLPRLAARTTTPRRNRPRSTSGGTWPSPPRGSATTRRCCAAFPALGEDRGAVLG